MRSLFSLGLSVTFACALFACSSSSSGGTVGDAGKDGTEPNLDAQMDTAPEPMGDGAPDGPPTCRMGCPKTEICCENGLSPNFSLCYAATDTAFCANEGGAP